MARRAQPRAQKDVNLAAIPAAVLAWYDRHRRLLPWRALPGERAEAYHVWLSEIMLQQTTVTAVAPYFADFLWRWPGLEDLAAAPLDELLTAWAGLGYYARARNLHRCAQILVAEHNGRFPETEAELIKLPGIGRYSAAAIAAIAFDQPATVVDGNIERVMARLFLEETPLPKAKQPLYERAHTLTPKERPGDYAQALMDLGATICLPRQPRCLACPLTEFCRGHAAGVADTLPRRAPKAERPTRRTVAFWITDDRGRVWLRRRPEKGLLGGMMELPSTDWRQDAWTTREAERAAPVRLAWRPLPGLVRHTFTHFHLEAELWAGQLTAKASALEGRWVALDTFDDEALPSVMRKMIAHAMKATAVVD